MSLDTSVIVWFVKGLSLENLIFLMRTVEEVIEERLIQRKR
jgi:hypothetical protein